MLRYSSPALLALALALGACSDKNDEGSSANTLAFNNYEQVVGWVSDIPAQATLTKEKAHSGVYSTSVRPGTDYAMGFSSPLATLTDHRPNKIRISAWVLLLGSEGKAKRGTEVKSGDAANTTQLYEAVELPSVVKKFNEWQQIDKTITLPATATATSRLQVYMWRADSNEPVYLDDMRISLAE